MERSLSQDEVPVWPPVPHSAIVAAIGWSKPSAVFSFPWWGVRSRVGVAIWSSPLVQRRRSPLVLGGSGGSPVPKDRSAWEGRAEALLQRRCSDWLERTMGDHSPCPWCCAGPDGCDPGRCLLVYAHGAQRGAPSMLVQSVADAAIIVAVPPRA